MVKLRFRQFNAKEQMNNDSTVLLLGKRGTGKSTLMRSLMYSVKDKLDFGLAMSPTEESTGSLGGFVPRTCFYNGFSGAALDVMLEIQRKAIKKKGKEACRNMYLILDDCGYDKKLMKGANMRELFMNGRHRNMFHMSTFQYMMDVPCDIRGNVDFVFALKDNNLNNRKKLYDYFFGVFDTFQDFDRVMKELTQDYSAIVIDNRVGGSDITECVYWYKADPQTPDFKLGQQVFWDLDEYYYRDRDEDNQETTMGVADLINPAEESQAKGIHMIERADVNGEIMSVVSMNNSYTGRGRR